VKMKVPLTRVNRLINPGPVVLVTAKHRDRVNVMPAAWAVPLSKGPPLVGVAIHPARFTHDLIRRSEQFALNVPGRPLAEAVVRLGSVSGHKVDDKLALVGLHLAEPQETEVPLIEECLAWLECSVVDALRIGDHTLFVGQVLAAQVDEQAFDQMWLLTDDDARPLHHLGSDLFAVLGEPFAVH
jgi:flavin reductase (DIM6/NTAB) family NADH-FMN oxidoreductase RutF